MFSENDEDFLESLPLNMCVQTLMQVHKERKKKEEKEKEETKIRKTNKSEKKRKEIIYAITYLPSNDAKNLTRSKD
jgi:hypothetical protein